MADIVDRCNDELAQLETLIAERRREKEIEESLKECEGCGNEIPEERRNYAKGCRLCIDCKELQETKERQYRTKL